MNGLLLTILITTNKQRVSKFLARLSLSLLLLSSLCFSLSLLFVILLNRYTLVFGNHKLTSLQRYRYWGLYVKHISLCLSTVSLLGDALLSVSVNFYLSVCLMMPTVPGLSLSLSLSFFFFFCCCVIVRQLRCEKTNERDRESWYLNWREIERRAMEVGNEIKGFLTKLIHLPNNLGRNSRVTRLGEISPLWHTVKIDWPFWKGLSIWQNFEMLWANFTCMPLGKFLLLWLAKNYANNLVIWSHC